MNLHTIILGAVKVYAHELNGNRCLVLASPLVQHLANIEHVKEVVHLLQTEYIFNGNHILSRNTR